MKCSDVDRILPDLVDGVAIEDGQDIQVQSHLKTCRECSALVSDLKLIASEARQLADSEEPSPRVWARIAIELRAEGLIKDSEFESLQPALLPAPQRRWNPLWLAPVAAVLLVAGSYIATHHPSNHATAQVIQPVIQKAGQKAQPQAQAQAAEQIPSQTSASPQQSQELAQNSPTSSKQAALSAAKKAPEPVEEADAAAAPPITDNEFLTEVSERAPTMRKTYANQLQAVNNEIRETKAYLSQYPGDVDARQHLLEVYEQKAMLYQMALDRIQ
jgi:hypothetical protein